MEALTLPYAGTVGVDVGSGGDGVLVGAIAPTAVSAMVLSTFWDATTAIAYTDDGGLYTDVSVAFHEDTADDVAVLPTVPANDDAFYLGGAEQFGRVDLNVTTDGDGTWTVVWQYWDGDSWETIPGLTDPTSGFNGGGTGIQSITFTAPVDWAKNTVDSALAYWIRGVVTGFSAVTTPPLIGQGWIIGDAAVVADLTAEANSATTDDVHVTSAYPIAGDRGYFGYGDRFCKLLLEVSTAATGTFTVAWKYWDGDSWAVLTTLDDSTVSFSESAGTFVLSFEPPEDWAANTAEDGPNGEAGYFVLAEVATATGVPTEPLIEQCWVLPLDAPDAVGITIPAGVESFIITGVSMTAITASAGGTDSSFLLLNASSGLFSQFTWTAAAAVDSAVVSLSVVAGDQLLVVQIQEQGTTEFADVSFIVMGA
jgi:hypothetical protein